MTSVDRRRELNRQAAQKLRNRQKEKTVTVKQVGICHVFFDVKISKQFDEVVLFALLISNMLLVGIDTSLSFEIAIAVKISNYVNNTQMTSNYINCITECQLKFGCSSSVNSR